MANFDYQEIMKLGDWFAQKGMKADSPVSEFLELFTLEFILDSLALKDRNRFLELLMARESNPFDFAISRIPNFQNKLSLALADKLSQMIALGEERGVQ
jgi:hypothetical protein